MSRTTFDLDRPPTDDPVWTLWEQIDRKVKVQRWMITPTIAGWRLVDPQPVRQAEAAKPILKPLELKTVELLSLLFDAQNVLLDHYLEPERRDLITSRIGNVLKESYMATQLEDIN